MKLQNVTISNKKHKYIVFNINVCAECIHYTVS